MLGVVELPFVRDTAPRLEGARVCELDNDENCLLTDGGGYVTIELPFEEEIADTIDKEGYDRALIPEFVPKIGIDHWWGIGSVEIQADFYERVMSPYPRIGTSGDQTLSPLGPVGTPNYAVLDIMSRGARS